MFYATFLCCFKVALVRLFLNTQIRIDEDDERGDDSDLMTVKKSKSAKRKGHSSSDSLPTSNEASAAAIIIFVSTCKRCQLVAELLLQLGVDCVAMHSLMTQARRTAALGKFKSQVSRILIATDIASRGLDVPEVDYVINLDLPKDARDYVHRVGRTARVSAQNVIIVSYVFNIFIGG